MRALLFVSLVLLSACGEPPGLSPEQQALFAQPVDAELVITTARNAMRYQTTRLEAPAGSTVRLVLDNSETTSPAMVHNAVVLRSERDVDRVGQAAAGAPNNIPDDAAILAHTPLAQPRTRSAVVFEMPQPGEYPFICTFPGHFQSMQGTLVSTGPADTSEGAADTSAAPSETVWGRSGKPRPSEASRRKKREADDAVASAMPRDAAMRRRSRSQATTFVPQTVSQRRPSRGR